MSAELPNITNPPTLPDKLQVPKLSAPARDFFESPALMHARAKAVAKELKRFLRQSPSQQLEIEGKKYPRVEAWQFVGACYGHTAMVTSTEELRDEKIQELGFMATAHIIDSTGRIVSGAEAACMRSESEWANAPSFQLKSMSQTRACAKGFRNLFSYVMVMAGLCATPAEEMPNFDEPSERWVKCYECGHKVSEKKSIATKRKYGKPLCLEHEKAENEKHAATVTEPLNDPKFVQQSVERVQARKAAQGQPIVDALDVPIKDEVGAD